MHSLLTDDDDPPGVARAQIDTGAFATVTDQLHLLHGYQEFGPTNPCPIRLMPATQGSDTIPKGFGYLVVPSNPHGGHVAVRAFYHPDLRTTVIDERDFVKASGYDPADFKGDTLHKDHDAGVFRFTAYHRLRSAQNVTVEGILRHGKCYTLPLIGPDLPADHPMASISTSSAYAAATDPEFAEECRLATLEAVAAYRAEQRHELREQLRTLPKMWHNIPFEQLMEQNIPLQSLRSQTERLLWHQRLGHPGDHLLHKAHEFVKGVPSFKHADPVLEQCPTCIQAKQKKEPASQNSTRTATEKYQGFSIDFGFAGVQSKNEDRREDYAGFYGETSWILVADHATRRLFGDTRFSKASPIEWLDRFLRTHSPDCDNKYVCLDQGGELYKNPKVRELFNKYDYKIRVTGADASNQNGPVERAHGTVAAAVRALLHGAGLGIKFWPFAFHHYLRLYNALPHAGDVASPLELTTGEKDDLTHFRTFGCRVWVRPPGRRRAKLRPNSRKGIFLGYIPNTTANIVWFDEATQRIKIAKHARFDEGLNDLPINEVPPNVQHLMRSEFGQPIPADPDESSMPQFNFFLNPFADTWSKSLPVVCQQQNYGLILENDSLMNRVFVKKINPRSSFHKAFPSKGNKLRGAFITHINNIPVFTQDDAVRVFLQLRKDGVQHIHLDFAREEKLNAADRRRAEREHHFDANPYREMDDDEHTPVLSVDCLRAIAAIRYPDLDFSTDVISSEEITIACNAIQAATTPEEHALGKFTRRKLKKLSTWPLWQAGEFKQLDHFHSLGMFGKPIPRPKGAIVLRPHWQYHIKRDGTRRSRNCCDGSPRAAPALHGIASTYSSSVDQPIQRLFFSLASACNFLVFGGDAQDAFAHSPPPEHPTFISLDNAYIEWYKERFGVDLDRSLVLPVLHAHQGHPESGRLWEQHIDKILASPELGFRSTTHARNIYRAVIDGHPVLLLRQVDDFAIACEHEETAKKICAIIGSKLQLPSEKDPPFKYLGLLKEFNGIDIQQGADGIHISCTSYIERVMKSHGWDTPPVTSNREKKSPIPEDSIDRLHAEPGFDDSTAEHQNLVSEFGFRYRTLLGELLYTYVTCRLDVGYALVLLSKYSHAPGRLHFRLLKDCAKYLRDTRHWGLQFYRPSPRSDLPPSNFAHLHEDPTLPVFPGIASPFTLEAYVDAAHANDLKTRRSTTGYAIHLCGAAIAYRTKTQSVTATSSTEAEFIAAVSTAKTVKYLRSVLYELGFKQHAPTIIREDNASAINMVNAPSPTERSRHIDIQHFAIQDWKRSKQIILQHIPGILNPADDLTKPLGWVLHSRHGRRNMGHFLPAYRAASTGCDPALSGSGEGVVLGTIAPDRESH